MAKFLVFNVTDQVYVTHKPVNQVTADKIIANFPSRFKQQGYYLTVSGQRIPANLVVLKKESISFKGIGIIPTKPAPRTETENYEQDAFDVAEEFEDEIFADEDRGGTGHGDISFSDADPGL